MNLRLKKLLLGLFSIVIFCVFSSQNVMGQLYYLNSIKKIDIHTHISSDAVYLREVMDKLNLKFFTICNKGLYVERMNFQVNAAKQFCNKYPRYYAWCTTFDLTRKNEPDWIDQVKMHLKNSFDNGAVAVKVWKDVGLEIMNPDGEFIQIDDPMFNPIFDYIEQEGKTLFYHIADPIQDWMPLPVEPDGKPQRHLRDKSGKPSYFEIIAAGDNMLAKHPNLKFVGCHFGSIDFDLDELAKRFDKYPNLAVDACGRTRTRYLIGQERGKVRAFFIKYQDRILYGSDISGGMIPSDYLLDMTKIGEKWTPEQVSGKKESLLRKYNDDFIYYGTDDEIPRGDYLTHGLALPEEVLYKIFYGNAVKWVLGTNKNF